MKQNLILFTLLQAFRNGEEREERAQGLEKEEEEEAQPQGLKLERNTGNPF